MSGVDAGVEHGDRLPLAVDALAEDGRRLAAGEPRLAHPDGGVVAQHATPLELDPEDVGEAGERRAQRGDLVVGEQQA
jgi:hypothetical protein